MSNSYYVINEDVCSRHMSEWVTFIWQYLSITNTLFTSTYNWIIETTTKFLKLIYTRIPEFSNIINSYYHVVVHFLYIEASEPKWVNTTYNTIGVNSLTSRNLHIYTIDFINTFTLASVIYWILKNYELNVFGFI